MMDKYFIQSIGDVLLCSNDTSKNIAGQAYLGPKTKKLFVKIVKEGHDPYTIPKHRVIFEHSANRVLLLEGIYNEIPVFTGSIFTTSYSLMPCIEVNGKEQAFLLSKTGFRKLIIRIRARNNYKTVLSDEKHKTTITQEAEVDDIYTKSCKSFNLKANTSYTLESEHLLTSGITFSFDFKKSVNVEFIDDIIKAFYIYFYLYHQGYVLIIDDIYIQSDGQSFKYYFDADKYKITTSENRKPPESIVDNINDRALDRIISSSINTSNNYKRIRNALNEFYEIISSQEIELSRGCILVCSIIEKLIGKNRIDKTRKKTMEDSILKVLSSISEMSIDEEVKNFYIKEPAKILGFISNEPFLERVEKYCNDNNIDIASEDREALSLVYKYRNELIHGQSELNEVDIAEKIQSKQYIEERDERGQKAFYYKYRAGAFHGIFTLTKLVLMKWLEMEND